jgi:hypothetical protein
MYEWQARIAQLLMQQLNTGEFPHLGGGCGEGKAPKPAEEVGLIGAADSQSPQQQSPTPIAACVAQDYHAIKKRQPDKQRLEGLEQALPLNIRQVRKARRRNGY